MVKEHTPLRGIVPPMVTPLVGRDRLDVDGLARLVEHLVVGGVHGIFILGTSGEAPSLGYRLRHELVERTCALAKRRVPILVGITDTAFVESVALAKKAADAGADGVVLAPPYYFPAGQAELLQYLEHLVPELPLPLYLYNMPTMTKLVFEPDTVRRAAEIPGIVGLKDSSANMVYFHKLQLLFKDRQDFSLLLGNEELLAETLLLGGHGGICGGANINPRLFVDLYEAGSRKDLDRTLALHERVMALSASIYGVGQYSSSYLKGLKCALSCMGICDDFMAEPFHRFRDEERKKIIDGLRANGLLSTQGDAV